MTTPTILKLSRKTIYSCQINAEMPVTLITSWRPHNRYAWDEAKAVYTNIQDDGAPLILPEELDSQGLELLDLMREGLAGERDRNLILSVAERTALVQLLHVAEGKTGQAQRVADFLLAWCDAERFGAWWLVDLWGVDDEIADNMLTELSAIRRTRCYPGTLGYTFEFDQLIRQWRPELADEVEGETTEEQSA